MSKSLLELTPVEAVACCPPLTAEPLTERQAEQAAQLLKALADPVRLRLMSMVASHEGGEACVCDLNDAFDLSQPTISHHLKVLHDSGLLDREKRGVWVYYRVRPGALSGLSRLVGDAMRIVPMTAEHADAVRAIYQAGIDEGDATFETQAPAWDGFDRGHLTEHRFVAVDGEPDDGPVVGWVAVSAVSDRCVYDGVVEHSVYVAPSARGRGVGAALLEALVASTEAAGIWTIQSGVFPENAASQALHERAGFRVVGTRERLGRQHGRWRDVVLLERRSSRM